jgi:putative ABC transport system substrate-binding protein
MISLKKGRMAIDIRRRRFISALGGGMIAWPLAASAQQPGIPVIGFLHAGSADGYASEMAAFQRGLRETGLIEGQNVAIEFNWVEGHYDRLPELASDLVRRHVAVIVAATMPVVVVVKQATDTIPIVFEFGGDPVHFGLVTSLNRPGGNVTGIVNLSNSLVPKRVELMHAVVPNAALIAVLLNPDSPNARLQMDDVQEAQKLLGIQIQFLQARAMGDIDAAFAKVEELRAGGLVIGADPYLTSNWEKIAALATRYGVPTSHERRDFVAAGGLMSYGADLAEAYHLAGIYTGRILKGEKPADLPVQQSTKVELSLNLKTAKALGITFPLTLLARADEVIE